MTDVTGFGLIGHLIEMCEGSSLSAQINVKYIPLIPGVETYINQYIIPDNTYRNWNSFENKVAGVSGPEFISLCDPQTSGGLLVAIQPDKLEQIRSLIKETSSLAEVAVIGRFIPSAGKVCVCPMIIELLEYDDAEFPRLIYCKSGYIFRNSTRLNQFQLNFPA